MQTETPPVLYAVDGAVARVTINRPEARNALSQEGMEGLFAAFDRAAEAERLGLVNHAVPADQLDAVVDELAAKIAAMSPAVVRLGRDAFYAMADLPFDQALDYLQTMLTVNLGSDDAIEGVRAFLEKREPVWKGR